VTARSMPEIVGLIFILKTGRRHVLSGHCCGVDKVYDILLNGGQIIDSEQAIFDVHDVGISDG
jgi:hypothetical protein